MATTTIDWTDVVWNPITGCSAGCNYCYAAKMAHRLQRMGQTKYRNGFTPTCHPGELAKPFTWKKPCRIFVNSMGDLFDPGIPFEFIDHILAVVALCPQHTFQVLTKQPARMLEYFNEDRRFKFAAAVAMVDTPANTHIDHWRGEFSVQCRAKSPWPLPNLWLGTTAETQIALSKRVPHMIKTPAAKRFISIEPMLGPIDLTAINGSTDSWGQFIDWVILGGGTGPTAKPISLQWVRTVRDQCRTAAVPFFFKQWGEWAPGKIYEGTAPWHAWKELRSGETEPKYVSLYGDEAAKGHELVVKIGKAKAGNILDGREWREFPCP